jgi:hypothetical protein
MKVAEVRRITELAEEASGIGLGEDRLFIDGGDVGTQKTATSGTGRTTNLEGTGTV